MSHKEINGWLQFLLIWGIIMMTIILSGAGSARAQAVPSCYIDTVLSDGSTYSIRVDPSGEISTLDYTMIASNAADWPYPSEEVTEYVRLQCPQYGPLFSPVSSVNVITSRETENLERQIFQQANREAEAARERPIGQAPVKSNWVMVNGEMRDRYGNYLPTHPKHDPFFFINGCPYGPECGTRRTIPELVNELRHAPQRFREQTDSLTIIDRYVQGQPIVQPVRPSDANNGRITYVPAPAGNWAAPKTPSVDDGAGLFGMWGIWRVVVTSLFILGAVWAVWRIFGRRRVQVIA